MPATQAAVPNQLEGNAEEQVAEVPAQRVDDKRPVVEPSASVQARRRHMDSVPAEENPAAELSSHLRDAEPEAIQGPSKEAAVTEVFPSALGQDDQGWASSIVIEAETANQPPTTVSTGRERRRKPNPGGVQKTQRAKPMRRRQPSGQEHCVTKGAPSAAVTQYNFRELAESSLTDPGRDCTNVTDREAWLPTIPLPSIETEPEPACNNGKVTITLHIYKQKQWRVADILSINPSRKDALEKIVWGYKQWGMFVYDMCMQLVSVSSSFQAATLDGANVLLLITKEAKMQMDQECSIELLNTATGLLCKRSKRQKND
ncbi:hypothetical protein FQN50_006460 [Emmonsiellopsis sp. PD_5]|nr:hypothetical protein FQN50_006460 [Emmonsiellopsis sp. PD_5]